MTAKQWLIVTGVVILNIIVFGTLLGGASADLPSTPTSTWTPHPTFTPMPFATATAILMPTLAAPPTPDTIVHVVSQGETLEAIAQEYGVSAFVLRMVNRIPETEDAQVGQALTIPAVGQ
jgi:LysM repeat protein